MFTLSNVLLALGVGWALGTIIYIIDYETSDNGTDWWGPGESSLFHDWTTALAMIAVGVGLVLFAANVISAGTLALIALGGLAAIAAAFLAGYWFPVVAGLSALAAKLP